MDALSPGGEFDTEPMPTDMLEDISDGSQSHPCTSRREARYKIRDHVKQKQAEWKGELLSTRNMGKV